MANAYLVISSEDHGERIQLKNESADRMASYIIKKGVSRPLLAQEAVARSNEGLILALATLINFAPQKGDFDLLLAVASKATRLHVRYRVVVALGTLLRQNLVGQGGQEEVLRILSDYEQGADESLARLIADTRSVLKSATN